MIPIIRIITMLRSSMYIVWVTFTSPARQNSKYSDIAICTVPRTDAAYFPCLIPRNTTAMPRATSVTNINWFISSDSRSNIWGFPI